MEKWVKHTKRESNQESLGFHRYIVPDTWYEKEDHPKVMLLLLARKFCADPKNPFYYDVFPHELFCRVMTFLASPTRLRLLGTDYYNSQTKLGKRKIQHYLLAQSYCEELENIKNEITGKAWMALGTVKYHTNHYKKSMQYLKRSLIYKNGTTFCNLLQMMYITIETKDMATFNEFAVKIIPLIPNSGHSEEWCHLSLDYAKVCIETACKYISTEETLERCLDFDAIIKILDPREDARNLAKNIKRQILTSYMILGKWEEALSVFYTLPEMSDGYSRKNYAAQCYFKLGIYDMAMEMQLKYCADVEKNCQSEFTGALDLYYQYSKVNAKIMPPDKIKWK